MKKIHYSFLIVLFAVCVLFTACPPEDEGEEGGGLDFKEYIIPESMYNKTATAQGNPPNTKILIPHNNSLTTAIKNSNSGSYFEVIFNKNITFTGGFLEFGTFLTTSGVNPSYPQYAGALVTFNGDGTDTITFNLDDAIISMNDDFNGKYPDEGITVTKAGLAGIDIQIYPFNNTDNAEFLKVTFFAKK